MRRIATTAWLVIAGDAGRTSIRVQRQGMAAGGIAVAGVEHARAAAGAGTVGAKDARRRAWFIAGLLAAALCGCAEGQPPGVVNVEGRRVPAVETGLAERARGTDPGAGARVGDFEVAGDNAYARALAEAGVPGLPDGWHGQVRVTAGCFGPDCLHWIAGSDDGLRRIEVLAVAYDSQTRNTTPDIVHHEEETVYRHLASVQWRMFPGAAEGEREIVAQGRGWHAREVTSGRLSFEHEHEHERDGTRLRSVIEVRASRRQGLPGLSDASGEPPPMGRTTIDLEMRTVVYTAPAAGFDLGAMAWIASGFGIGGPRPRPDPGSRVDCDPSQGTVDPACAALMDLARGGDDPMPVHLPADEGW